MALNEVVLDTSAYSALKRGHAEVVALLRQVERILLPTVVLGELLAGFHGGSRREQNRRELAAFRQTPRVRTVFITDATAERYAHIYAYLRGAGRPIPTNDLWIAAATMEHSAQLLTTDDHFRNLPQIVVRYYPM